MFLATRAEWTGGSAPTPRRTACGSPWSRFLSPTQTGLLPSRSTLDPRSRGLRWASTRTYAQSPLRERTRNPRRGLIPLRRGALEALSSNAHPGVGPAIGGSRAQDGTRLESPTPSATRKRRRDARNRPHCAEGARREARGRAAVRDLPPRNSSSRARCFRTYRAETSGWGKCSSMKSTLAVAIPPI